MNWLILGGGTAAVLALMYYTRNNRGGSAEDGEGEPRSREGRGEWPVLVKSSRLGELQLLKTRLDSENVDAILETEHCGGYGMLPIFDHQLRVPSDQFNVARGILKESDFGRRHVS